MFQGRFNAFRVLERVAPGAAVDVAIVESGFGRSGPKVEGTYMIHSALAGSDDSRG